jgi:SAM-dependent methyltransferase
LPVKETGGTNSARYCYEVWLKHLTLLWQNGMRSIPDTMAELGPGDSIGVGLAAMLSGVNHYYALDVVRYSDIETNVQIFDELLTLFESRAARPTRGWPDYDQYLDDNLFPGHILNDNLLRQTLDEKRIAAIRRAVTHIDHENDHMGLTISYMVPWSDQGIIKRNSVDLILSHAVLEHVADIEDTYRAFYLWLKPRGTMSHQIDFKSHGLSDKWNGYRGYSEFLWKMIMGRRPFLINRKTHSEHVDCIRKNGFHLICDLTRHRTDGLRREDLSDYWKNMTDEDLTCSEAFIQAEKGA